MKYLLFIGPGIGDFFMAVHVARRIKLADEQAYITVFSRNNSHRVKLQKELLQLQSWIDDVYYYSLKELGCNINLIFNLLKMRYDYSFRVCYVDSKRVSGWPNKIMRLVSKCSLGTSISGREDLKYDLSIKFDKNGNFYSFYGDLLSKIGINHIQNELEYGLFNSKNCFLKKECYYINIIKTFEQSKVIAFFVGSEAIPVSADRKSETKKSKRWPISYWDKLFLRLIEHGYCLLLLGNSEEYEEYKNIIALKNKNVFNLCGRTSLAESIYLVSNVSLVVGVDTGFMHCAGAIGTTSLTLFGCTSYKNYLPLSPKAYYIQSDEKCSPCFGTDRLAHCSDFHCMKKISVEEVYNKIISILGANSGN